MQKVTFRGTESERSVYCMSGKGPSIKRALEARGYTADLGNEVNPWQEDPERSQMIAVTGRLIKGETQGLLYLVDSEEAMDAAWEAIHFYFPDADSNPMETLDRPA